MAPATGAVVVGVIAVARHGAQTAEGLHPFDLRAQRLGEIVGHARVVRDRPAIPHQDHEGLEDVSVLVAHVLSEIEVWLARLALGNPLPVLPLGVRGFRAVPVDLEATYSDARERSRL